MWGGGKRIVHHDDDDDDDDDEDCDGDDDMMRWMVRTRRKMMMLRRKTDPLTGKHILRASLRSRNAHVQYRSQEPFCVEIYRMKVPDPNPATH